MNKNELSKEVSSPIKSSSVILEDLLKQVTDIINTNYKVQYVVEIGDRGDEDSVFYLKQRRTIRLPFNRVKHMDSYEMNGIGSRLVFKNLFSIIEYLKLMYSEREGFIIKNEDLV